MTKRRNKIDGRMVPAALAKAIASGDELPTAWAPRPGEDLVAWGNRVNVTLVADTLLKSRRYEDQAFGWHYLQLALDRLSPAKQAIDITARQDDWLRNLTQDELIALDRLRQEALARSIPQDVVIQPIFDSSVQSESKPSV